MDFLASQPYIKVIRTMEWNKQVTTVEEKTLHLYKDKIITDTNQFYLNHVWDISYKTVSSEYGFLYLHTHQGVVPFQVPTNPQSFIHAFKQLRDD